MCYESGVLYQGDTERGAALWSIGDTSGVVFASQLAAVIEKWGSSSCKNIERCDFLYIFSKACDVFSWLISAVFALFQNCSKTSVMQRALPVAVKFLHKGNRELSRHMASYLSLAAIEHASLLTPHVQPIMDSIISGKYCVTSGHWFWPPYEKFCFEHNMNIHL